MDNFEVKVNTELTEIKKKVNYLQKNVNSQNTSELSEKVENIENQLNEKVGGIENQLTNINFNMNNLKTVAYSASYNDLINLPEVNFEPIGTYKANFFHITELPNLSLENMPITKLHFVCSPEAYLEGKLTITYRRSRGSIFSTVLNIFLNEEIFNQIPVSFTTGSDKVMEVNFKLYPKQKNNYFYMEIPCTPTERACVINIDLQVTSSKNIFILTRDYRKNVFVYKHKYYITYNSKFNSDGYFILDKDNFDLSTPLFYEYNYGPCQTVYPMPVFTSSSLTVSETEINFVQRDYIYLGVKCTRTLYTYNFLVFNNVVTGFGITFFRNGFAYTNCPTVTGIFTNEGILGLVLGNQNINRTDFLEFTFNNEPLQRGCWVELIPVVQLDMTNAPTSTFQGAVAVREDGYCYFLPNVNSTYILPLGFGRMPSAFRQENGDLHIYIGKVNCVTRLILKKNTFTEQYEIKYSQVIYGAEQYYETLDNKAIIIVDNQIKLIDAWFC